MLNIPRIPTNEERLRSAAKYIAELEASQKEFHLFLSYMITKNGGSWTISKVDLANIEKRVIRSEINQIDQTMTFTFAEQTNNGIIKP